MMRIAALSTSKRIQEMINRITVETGWYEPGDEKLYDDVTVGNEFEHDQCALNEITEGYTIYTIVR